MRSNLALTLLLACSINLLKPHSTDAAKCPQDISSKCPQTEYGAFLKCLQSHRIKRQACTNIVPAVRIVSDPCISTCNSGCVGVNCYDKCVATCQAPAQQAVPVCSSTNCAQVACTAPNCFHQSTQHVSTCHETCMTSCSGYNCKDHCDRSCQTQPEPIQRVVSCRDNCMTSCAGDSCQEYCDRTCRNQGNVDRNFTSSSPSAVVTILEKDQKVQANPSPVANVTTIIKLTNIVNNTNHINVPTTINNTNINNIDIIQNGTGTQSSDSTSQRGYQRESCCQVVQPKTCDTIVNEKNETVHRCIHRRHHTCGPQCRSRVVHAQVRQPCEGNQDSCPVSLTYVPQPQPRCIYQSIWPYVACGYQDRSSCEGCYDHYGYGFERYHATNPDPPSCSGCFDDGYEVGSLYRQGPMYRPGYYHAPPCHMTNTCGYIQQPMAMSMDCGFGGCFGHELIDPVFGAQSFSPYSSPMMMNPYPSYQQYAPVAPMTQVVSTPLMSPMAPMSPMPLMSPMNPLSSMPLIAPMPQMLPTPAIYPYEYVSVLNNDTKIDKNNNSTDENAIIPEIPSIIQTYPYAYGQYPRYLPYNNVPYYSSYLPMTRPYSFPNLNETVLISEIVQKK